MVAMPGIAMYSFRECRTEEGKIGHALVMPLGGVIFLGPSTAAGHRGVFLTPNTFHPSGTEMRAVRLLRGERPTVVVEGTHWWGCSAGASSTISFDCRSSGVLIAHCQGDGNARREDCGI